MAGNALNVASRLVSLCCTLKWPVTAWIDKDEKSGFGIIDVLDNVKISLAAHRDVREIFCDLGRVSFVFEKRILLDICIYASDTVRGSGDSAPRIFALTSKRAVSQLEMPLTKLPEFNRGTIRIVK